METHDSFADGPSSDERGPEDLIREGQDALSRQVWESAARCFKAALLRVPGDARAHLGLARSYQGQAGRDPASPFLRLAWDHCLSALRADPASPGTLDASLALGGRLGRLDDVLAELRTRLREDPSSETWRAAIRKVETLLALSVRPRESLRAPRSRTQLVLRIALPGLVLLSLGGALVLRRAGSEFAQSFSPLLFRGGIFLAAIYLAYRFVESRWL
jgi:hypothetical protein